ncbi:MAG: hypothetical protein Q8P68_01385 [Candidatus Peregrinibacteria bacterium]|nr:hypothetical protein [Candidatus Peregrinibacteria bacterium]
MTWSGLLLIFGLAMGWYITNNITQSGNEGQQASAKEYNFNEYCIKNNFECSIEVSNSTETYTVVSPWVKTESDGWKFMLGWQAKASYLKDGSYKEISRWTGPAFHFSWDAAKTVRDIDLKKRQLY